MYTTDSETNIKKLRDMLRQFTKERGWEQFHTPKNLAGSILIEAAELMELYQWNDPSPNDVKNDSRKLQATKEELSDILAYILLMANSLDIDVSSSFLEKLEKTKKKYPKEEWFGRS